MHRKRVNLGIAAVVAIAGLVACGPDVELSVRDGDLIFHESRSTQSEALRVATNSPYTHVGMIFLEGGDPWVYEAVGPVKRTPLSDWIARGAGGRFVIKRLAEAESLLTENALVRLRSEAAKYVGRPYDDYFEWSDERVYCSEFVWKVYRSALGIEVGELEAFGDLELSDPIVAGELQSRFGDRVPLDETVVTPVRMLESPELVTVLER